MSERSAALPAQSTRSISILDSHFRTAPGDQNAIDIFQGEWASQFPPPFDHLKAGSVGLFQDVRVAWAIQALGGIGGQTVLELGPLEGGHACMLEHAGAAFVTSIEANSRAYLKCLIAKEILQLERTRFWCGNFIPFLETTSEKFDLVIAAGVLYHMPDPVRLLQLIARCTDRVYLWTHYFDDDIITANPNLNCRFQGHNTVRVGDATVILHHQFYKAGLKEKSYCGGIDVSSKWLTRDGILATLKHAGFTGLEIGFETPNHPNGPCMAVVASKR